MRFGPVLFTIIAADPTFDWTPYQALRKKLPPAMAPPPSAEDYRSFARYLEWQRRTMNIAFPESELRSVFATTPDGGMGEYIKASTG